MEPGDFEMVTESLYYFIVQVIENHKLRTAELTARR
jgi:hypothetical protein